MLLLFLLRRRLKVSIFPTQYTSQSIILPKFSFCSLSSTQPQKPSIPPESIPKPSSLSARMSFVFDQIDAIEKERSQKDQTLQRIRAWRESKKQPSKEMNLDPVETTRSEKKLELVKKDENGENAGLLNDKREVELVHPWPEWIELMERLVQQNYFDHKRKDEEGMIENLGFNLPEMVEEEGFDFTRDFKTVQTAVLNFGRDRFDILRSLSRQDLQILVGYGCPCADKKVVFSSKLLRKHVHVDEGDVCSTCSLRNTCERAYLLTNKEDEARTIDVMRVLLTYGFDVVNGSVTNKSLLKMKSLKTVVRKLIHEVVKLSAVPIDPNLPPPVIRKPPPKVKQPPPTPKRRVGRDDIEMKKGDWLCVKCDFMNFAKNTVCLQCDAKRPKRQLLPGEWECPQCNFLNYRRNTVCFHCEHKRPPEEFVENPVQERHHGPRRLENISGRPEISNAWNFDFDDNESDGADVAAFEYADSKMMNKDFTPDKQSHGGIGRGRDDGFYKGSRPPRLSEREHSDAGPSKPGLGFNDFDDEEDDDLENYELDTRNEVQMASTVNFSELEVDSFSEDDDTADHDWTGHRKSGLQTQNEQSTSFAEYEDKVGPSRNVHQHFSSRAQNKPSQARRKAGFSGSDTEIDFGTDDDLPIHPNWKSSHVNQRSKGRGSMTFGSGDELSSDSDFEEDDFGSRQKKGNKWRANGSSRKQQRFNFDNEASSDEESKTSSHFNRKGLRGGKSGLNARGNTSTGRGVDRKRNPTRDSFPRSSRGSHGRGFEDDDVYRRNPTSARSKNFRSPRKEGSYKQRQDKYGNSSKQGDSYLDDKRFQRPRINVR